MTTLEVSLIVVLGLLGAYVIAVLVENHQLRGRLTRSGKYNLELVEEAIVDSEKLLEAEKVAAYYKEKWERDKGLIPLEHLDALGEVMGRIEDSIAALNEFAPHVEHGGVTVYGDGRYER